MAAKQQAGKSKGRVRQLWSRWWQGPQERSVDVLPVRLGADQYRNTKAVPPAEVGLDQALIWVVVGLLVWGLVMVYSASIAMADNPRFGAITPYHFVLRHGIALVIGGVAATLAFSIPMAWWERWAPWLLILALVLLVLVLIPYVGLRINGSRRWLPLGVMNFQPSELAKFAVLLYAADYMVRRAELKEQFFRTMWPIMAVVVVTGGLLILEPDMGSLIVIVTIVMGIVWLGGINAGMFMGLAGVVLSAFAVLIAVSPYRRGRFFAYLNPWDMEHALNKSYQLTHALIAIGRGEFWGVGLGRSVEKLHWLPEAHTDFLLSVLGEEFGFVGMLVAIGAFFWLIRRITSIGREAIVLDRVFSGLVAQGVAIWLGFQAFINMGVNLGLLPTKGLTLPLLSFGGSAVLLNLIAIAVVLRVDYENKILQNPRGRA